MSLYAEHGTEIQTLPPCAACVREATWIVWGYRVCVTCFNELRDAEPCTVNSIGHGDDHEAFTTEATRRTATWVSQKRSTTQDRRTP